MIMNIDTYSINYIDEGVGEAVLLLHGWGANLKSFSNLINQLKVKYRVIAFDYPGFGESSELKKSFTVDDYVDVTIKLIEKLGITKLILIGHSYGGRIIIKLNSRKELPFSITKNVLIDAAGLKDKKDIRTNFRIKLFKILKRIVYLLPIDKKIKEQFEYKLKAKFGSKDYTNASKVMQETLVKSVNEDLTHLLHYMRETLLIWGDNDNVTPVWMANVMKDNISNSGLVILHGGHFSYIDDPIVFSRVMESYFNL